MKSYCTCPANQTSFPLFRVNGLIQPEAYRSDTVQKTFWHGDVQPEGQGDDFVQGTAAPGQGISSGETWLGKSCSTTWLVLRVTHISGIVATEHFYGTKTFLPNRFIFNKCVNRRKRFISSSDIDTFSYLLKTMLRHQRLEQCDVKVKSALETVWPSPVYKWKLALLISLI